MLSSRFGVQRVGSLLFSRTIAAKLKSPRILLIRPKHSSLRRTDKPFTLINALVGVGVGVAGVGFAFTSLEKRNENPSLLFPVTTCDAVKGGEVVMYGPTAEPSTGILFPPLCNGLTFVGCGVRVKYRFVKVYAVGTYVDPTAMDYVKKQGDQEIAKALLDPRYPRTIRVVMNRSLSMNKYTAAIVEALEPRMNGEDLDKLEEFKKLNPPGDLVEGAVMEMTIRGDTLLYRNSAGTVGAIHSDIFCRALCDVYYGADAVSPTHKDDVIKGIKLL